MTELEELQEKMKGLETEEKCLDLKDDIKAKEKDLKLRNIRKGIDSLRKICKKIMGR